MHRPRARPSRLRLLLPILLVAAGADAVRAAKPDVALVVHGGAGTITRGAMTPELEAEYRAALEKALATGYAILAAGGSSLDAVESTLEVLEESPLFNAGKGSVFTADGRNELDASIMDGDTRRAGAVAGVTRVRSPISAARAVMEKSPHVLLAGPGAEEFAAGVGLEMVDPSYFFTEKRWRQLEERRKQEEAAAGGVAGAVGAVGPAAADHLGTVGAVALDRSGHLAAGTSTGGMTYKKHGRVGDSPIIGAGTWADRGCGVSSTGHGEFFIRFNVAHDICARMEYRGVSLVEAANEVIHQVLGPAGGEGGIIALDAAGNRALVFNSEGMYRGWVLPDGTPRVSIYKNDG